MNKNYSAWEIQLADFPKQKGIEDKIKFFTRFGILAANIHNTQPWRFRINKNILTISPNSKYQLSAGDPSGHNIYITIGCCVSNIECVASYFGFEILVKYHRDVNKKIEVQLTFSPTKHADKELSHLALFLTKRYSNKLPYLSNDIPKQAL